MKFPPYGAYRRQTVTIRVQLPTHYAPDCETEGCVARATHYIATTYEGDECLPTRVFRCDACRDATVALGALAR